MTSRHDIQKLDARAVSHRNCPHKGPPSPQAKRADAAPSITLK
ncbi:hypothetical protein OAF50_00685 [bacterium]|nr:hypothetical protein [bacterium]